MWVVVGCMKLLCMCEVGNCDMFLYVFVVVLCVEIGFVCGVDICLDVKLVVWKGKVGYCGVFCDVVG